MYHFYVEHSTMIHVVDGNEPTINTSNLDEIDEHLKNFNVDTVEMKSINSLKFLDHGVLLVVMGSVKLKDFAICRNFVHIMYLAPHWKKNAEKRGYFIFNDILHIITHHYDVRHHKNPVKPLKSEVVTEIGEFLASQYYVLLCREPDQMQRFYSQDSTMIHVIDGDDTTRTIVTSNLYKIDKHIIKELNVDTVEIKSTNSLNCWGLGVLLVVMGSVKLKEKKAICRDFVQTMYLAPHAENRAMVTDNGNLDEAKVEKPDDLMSTMENRIEFPPLPQKQPLCQRGFGPSVWKTPLAQVEASPSN
ncbi:hypothetical protein TSUD_29590 [Trifolium subterraneum]|uniref:NTF2 domain-containing protein n=1 Tax=Trifolium subterraneum TaxID=3900 RepID=A0A2Z6NDM2_TRISU|nr:hypothetical protein TSUD_29590 [Trifolium subterraneum]